MFYRSVSLSLSRSLSLGLVSIVLAVSLLLSAAQDALTKPPPPLLTSTHETLNLSVMKHLSAFLECEMDGDRPHVTTCLLTSGSYLGHILTS